jgi:hypothetical protein
VSMVEIVCSHVWKWKMRPVETIPGMGRGGIKANDGEVNSTMIYCKNFCKSHSVPPIQQ